MIGSHLALGETLCRTGASELSSAHRTWPQSAGALGGQIPQTVTAAL